MLVSAAAVPWLIALRLLPGGFECGSGGRGLCWILLYVWTDFPINYVGVRDAALFSGDPRWAGARPVPSADSWSGRNRQLAAGDALMSLAFLCISRPR